MHLPTTGLGWDFNPGCGHQRPDDLVRVGVRQPEHLPAISSHCDYEPAPVEPFVRPGLRPAGEIVLQAGKHGSKLADGGIEPSPLRAASVPLWHREQ